LGVVGEDNLAITTMEQVAAAAAGQKLSATITAHSVLSNTNNLLLASLTDAFAKNDDDDDDSGPSSDFLTPHVLLFQNMNVTLFLNGQSPELALRWKLGNWLSLAGGTTSSSLERNASLDMMLSPNNNKSRSNNNNTRQPGQGK
jgi:hypothetical protein